VATIGTRFGGIPAGLPAFRLPWTEPGLEGLSPALLGELAPSALAIALLGAIESLLCAVVADGMTGSRHDPDAELVGQGLGNLVAPFFGGFAATGAVARTATAIRAGARSPFAAVVHAGFVLVAMLALAPLLSTLPMAGLAALLLVVAWNMSDARHVVKMLRIAPRSDIAVLLTCLVLTVAFDMVVAVSVGVVLASLLFMRRMAEISGATLVGGEHQHEHRRLPPGVVVYEIAGPLFFGAAERALAALGTVEGAERVVVIDLEDVPAMDATGLVALESALAKLRTSGARVVLADVRPQPARVLAKAGLGPGQDWLDHAATVEEALAALTG
jgi:SulP family sulfate permease